MQNCQHSGNYGERTPFDRIFINHHKVCVCPYTLLGSFALGRLMCFCYGSNYDYYAKEYQLLSRYAASPEEMCWQHLSLTRFISTNAAYHSIFFLILIAEGIPTASLKMPSLMLCPLRTILFVSSPG